MTCPAAQLANKIEVHLKLDESPGYYLTPEDQRMIVDCLRFTSLHIEVLNEADAMVGALWSDLFNKDLVTASAADYFDKWRGRIRALVVTNGEG